MVDKDIVKPTVKPVLKTAFRSTTRRKLSDIISDEIKRWVLVEGCVAGDRLPCEQEMTAQFLCSRGTLREALKSLEVQGLITVTTGPNGGPMIATVSYECSARQLRNYLHFRTISIEHVYDLRIMIEVETAVAAVGHLDSTDFIKLEASVACCHGSAWGVRRRVAVRQAELDFHVVLAECCPNPLLAFQAKFISDLLRDYIEFDTHAAADFDRFTADNCAYHKKLIDAYRATDAALVRRIMTEHVESARQHTMLLNGSMAEALLMPPEAIAN